MGLEIARLAFTARSLGTAQAVRSAAHIGAGMVAPANGEVVSDLGLTEFEELLLIAKPTFAYTGGSTNPNLNIRVQAKFAHDLVDTDDDAWTDVGAFATFAADGEQVVHLGLHEVAVATMNTTATEYAPQRDALTAGQVLAGRIPSKLRIRETVAGGDRTGGSLTYDLRIVGRSNQHHGG